MSSKQLKYNKYYFVVLGICSLGYRIVKTIKTFIKCYY